LQNLELTNLSAVYVAEYNITVIEMGHHKTFYHSNSMASGVTSLNFSKVLSTP